MPFEPGHEKVGGRKKGSLNKKTEILGDALEALSFDPVKKLVDVIPLLSDADQAKVLLGLMEYLYPKRKAIEHSGPDGGPIETSDVESGYLAELKAELMALVKPK